MFQSKPGPALLANYAVPAAVVAQSLGRLPSRNVTNVTVNLIEPGSMYGDRRNELDLRVAKILRFRRTRTTVGADIYNLLNDAAVLQVNPTFGGALPWQSPRCAAQNNRCDAVVKGRLFKVSAQFDF